MEEFLARVWENVIGRASGPMKFRILLQPTMAAIFAIRAGLRDAREGRAPYLWAIFKRPEHRKELLREGWKDVGKVFLLAVLIDIAYQVAVFHRFYPGEALLVAALLAFLTYLLVRGPVNRIARRRGVAPGDSARPSERNETKL
jgi:hypothetical protein